RCRPAAYLFIQVLKISPNSAAVRTQLSRAYEKIGDKSSAAEQARLAKELLAADLRAAEMASDRDRHPTDPAVRMQLARFYSSHRRYRSALAELQAAYAISPKSHDVFANMSAQYKSLGLEPPPQI